MDLHLTPAPDDRTHLRIFLHGALVGEYAVDQFDDRDTLAAQVRQVHYLANLCACVEQLMRFLQGQAGPRTAQSRPSELVLRGLTDGWQGVTVPHGLPGVPPILPEYAPPYPRAYAHGRGLAQVVQAVGQGEAPP